MTSSFSLCFPSSFLFCGRELRTLREESMEVLVWSCGMLWGSSCRGGGLGVFELLMSPGRRA